MDCAQPGLVFAARDRIDPIRGRRDRSPAVATSFGLVAPPDSIHDEDDADDDDRDRPQLPDVAEPTEDELVEEEEHAHRDQDPAPPVADVGDEGDHPDDHGSDRLKQPPIHGEDAETVEKVGRAHDDEPDAETDRTREARPALF